MWRAATTSSRASAAPRVGGGAGAVWLSTVDGAVAAGRLEGERKTGVAVVSRRGPDGADEAAKEAGRSGPRATLARDTAPQQRWSMDFVHDRLVDGRPVRILTVIDQFTRDLARGGCGGSARDGGADARSAPIDHGRQRYGVPESRDGRLGHIAVRPRSRSFVRASRWRIHSSNRLTGACEMKA